LAIVNSLLTSPALEINLAWLYAAPAVGGVLIVVYGLAAALEVPADELEIVEAPAAPLAVSGAGDN
jgi:TRAP-type C4-dicarboxylate transport system permease small subunit